MPTRGKARKIGIRVEARPGRRRARQNGEFADSASRIGTCTRIPLATWIALSGSSMPDVDVQPEDDLLARDEAQRLDQVAVALARGDPLVLPARERMRAGRADAQPVRAGDLGDLTAQRAQRLAGLARVRARAVGDLEHRLHQLRLDVAVAVVVVEHRLDRIGPARASRASRIISSSSIPSVYSGPLNFGSHAAA